MSHLDQQQPPHPAAGASQSTPSAPPAAPMNTLAIVSLIASFFVSVVGIVCGHIALSQIKRSGDRGRGIALFGTILGYVFLVTQIIAAAVMITSAAMFSAAVDQERQEITEHIENRTPEEAEADSMAYLAAVTDSAAMATQEHFAAGETAFPDLAAYAADGISLSTTGTDGSDFCVVGTDGTLTTSVGPGPSCDAEVTQYGDAE